MTSRPPAPTKARTKPSSATSPPVDRPACWVAAALALPAVSQADRMTTSASRCRSKISRKVSKPVRSFAAEAGQQRRLRRAFGGTGGDDAVSREMDDTILVEIAARLERGVGELVTGDNVDAVGIELLQDRCRHLQFAGRYRMTPRRQRQQAVAVGRCGDLAFRRSRGRRVFAQSEIFLAASGWPRASQLRKGAWADRRADVAVAAEPAYAAEVVGGIVACLGAGGVSVDRGLIHDQQLIGSRSIAPSGSKMRCLTGGIAAAKGPNSSTYS